MTLKCDDLKRLRNLFTHLTGRKLGFSSIKNSKEWIIFEVEQ